MPLLSRGVGSQRSAEPLPGLTTGPGRCSVQLPAWAQLEGLAPRQSPPPSCLLPAAGSPSSASSAPGLAPESSLFGTGCCRPSWSHRRVRRRARRRVTRQWARSRCHQRVCRCYHRRAPCCCRRRAARRRGTRPRGGACACALVQGPHPAPASPPLEAVPSTSTSPAPLSPSPCRGCSPLPSPSSGPRPRVHGSRSPGTHHPSGCPQC